MQHDAPVYVIDDESDVCHAIQHALQTEGIASRTFTSAKAFVAELGSLAPGSIVSDVCMPDMDGLELLALLRRLSRHDPVILISGNADIPLAVRAMRGGASDFVEKPFDTATLIAAIKQGRAPDPRDNRPSVIASLSPRELEVLKLVVGGLTSKQIASVLEISPRTVEIHRARAMQKLEISSLPQLVRLVIEYGLL